MHDRKKMKKIIILIPVYNDWESLEKLLAEINISIENIKNIEFQCIVINDASTDPPPKTKVPSNISSLKIITMKENQGHGRCNAFGVRYLSKNDDYDYVILMDGDGEDRPEEIKLLVEKAISISDISVVAKRVKRSEGYFFQFLYQVHKIITLIFTGKNINFGNYSCLTKKDIKFLSSKKSLWSSFSGSIKYHIPKLNSINSIRGVRYFGPSKMSLFKLGIHSLSIISVFKSIVFVRSLILIFLISYLSKFIGIFVIILQLCLVLFGLLIFLVSLRENEKDFLNSDRNQGEVKVYTH
jgi:glycosyltransferase involved in cell wall biosynthesis